MNLSGIVAFATLQHLFPRRLSLCHETGPSLCRRRCLLYRWTMKACGDTPIFSAAATALCLRSSESFSDVVDISSTSGLRVLLW